MRTPAAVPASADSINGTTRIEELTQPRWYPVVDYDRCDNCQDCTEFCVFEVFDADDEGMLLVLRPDDCFDGCPACRGFAPPAPSSSPITTKRESRATLPLRGRA